MVVGQQGAPFLILLVLLCAVAAAPFGDLSPEATPGAHGDTPSNVTHLEGVQLRMIRSLSGKVEVKVPVTPVLNVQASVDCEGTLAGEYSRYTTNGAIALLFDKGPFNFKVSLTFTGLTWATHHADMTPLEATSTIMNAFVYKRTERILLEAETEAERIEREVNEFRERIMTNLFSNAKLRDRLVPIIGRIRGAYNDYLMPWYRWKQFGSYRRAMGHQTMTHFRGDPVREGKETVQYEFRSVGGQTSSGIVHTWTVRRVAIINGKPTLHVPWTNVAEYEVTSSTNPIARDIIRGLARHSNLLRLFANLRLSKATTTGVPTGSVTELFAAAAPINEQWVGGKLFSYVEDTLTFLDAVPIEELEKTVVLACGATFANGGCKPFCNGENHLGRSVSLSNGREFLFQKTERKDPVESCKESILPFQRLRGGLNKLRQFAMEQKEDMESMRRMRDEMTMWNRKNGITPAEVETLGDQIMWMKQHPSEAKIFDTTRTFSRLSRFPSGGMGANQHFRYWMEGCDEVMGGIELFQEHLNKQSSGSFLEVAAEAEHRARVRDSFLDMVRQAVRTLHNSAGRKLRKEGVDGLVFRGALSIGASAKLSKETVGSVEVSAGGVAGYQMKVNARNPAKTVSSMMFGWQLAFTATLETTGLGRLGLKSAAVRGLLMRLRYQDKDFVRTVFSKGRANMDLEEFDLLIFVGGADFALKSALDADKAATAVKDSSAARTALGKMVVGVVKSIKGRLKGSSGASGWRKLKDIGKTLDDKIKAGAETVLGVTSTAEDPLATASTTTVSTSVIMFGQYWREKATKKRKLTNVVGSGLVSVTREYSLTGAGISKVPAFAKKVLEKSPVKAAITFGSGVWTSYEKLPLGD